MALTTARKKANAKYEAKAYDKTLIRLPKGRLDKIRAHIKPIGESLNGFIGRAIMETMERDINAEGATLDSASRSPEAPETLVGARKISLPSNVLENAQRAGKQTGETLIEFIVRAIETQVEQDKKSIMLDTNPVTRSKLNQIDKGDPDHK